MILKNANFTNIKALFQFHQVDINEIVVSIRFLLVKKILNVLLVTKRVSYAYFFYYIIMIIIRNYIHLENLVYPQMVLKGCKKIL